jgi:hypothetical protein
MINIIVNAFIFSHVRSSSRRVNPQIISAITNTVNAVQQKISRREISLLQQMIFMFSMFVIGWSPSYITIILSYFISLDPMTLRLAVLFSELCLLGIIMNLFIHNHELRQYLMNNIRRRFGYQ